MNDEKVPHNVEAKREGEVYGKREAQAGDHSGAAPPPSPAGIPPVPSGGPPSSHGSHAHIGKELEVETEDRRRTGVMVAVVLAAIAAAVAFYSYTTRPKPKANGSIDDAFAVALAGDNVLSTIKVTLNNVGGKPLWIKEIKARLTTAEGTEYSDVAASPNDFERYFQGYPDLRDHAIAALKVETKMEPEEVLRGSIIVSFPVTLAVFNQRKSISVIIYPYASNPYAAAVTPGGEEQVVITRVGH